MREARKLLGNSSIIFIGTMVGSVFSYIFNTLVGRWLGPSQYGEFTALMSLLMIISVGGGAVLTVTMRYSGELYALKNFQALRKLFKIFTRYLSFAGVSLFLVGLIFTKPIAHFFSIEHNVPVIIALFSFIFGFLIVVNKGILQGTQKFTAVAFVGTLESLLRLVVGLVLIKVGFQLTGAVLGSVVATIIVYFVTFIPLAKILKNKKGQSTEFSFDKKEIINYSWPTFMVTLLMAIGLNIDVILVKHYFPAKEAGVYAAISTIAKIILYTTGPIATVMFPMISEYKIKGEKHYQLFLFSLLLTLIGAFLILGIYYVSPGRIISLLFGSQYAGSYQLLPQVGFAILLYALVNIITNYFLSIKNFFFLPFLAIIIGTQIAVIAMWHPSIEAVIKVIISTLGLLFVLLFCYYLFTKKEQIFSHLRGTNES